MENTQPPVFSVGVVEGSTGVWAMAAVSEDAMNTEAPARTARSLRDVFIWARLSQPEDPAATDLACRSAEA
jgi:hypothetical protein